MFCRQPVISTFANGIHSVASWIDGWLELQVIQAEHVPLDRLLVGAFDFDGQLMVASFQLMSAQLVDLADHAVVEQVDRLASRIAVERDLYDAVVDGFGQFGRQFVRAVLLDRNGQRQLVARLAIDPPELFVAAPAELGDLLDLRVAARNSDDLQGLAFQGPLDRSEASARQAARS